jgi:hypothetical protein
MGNLIDQIRQFAVPAPILKKAVLGNLAIPPAEQIEILVFLSVATGFCGRCQAHARQLGRQHHPRRLFADDDVAGRSDPVFSAHTIMHRRV